MTVTIGVPFRGDPGMLAQCVGSLLKQTHTDLRVLVIGDGQDPELSTRDSRVDVIELEENRGSYFSRAVALAATDTTHHAIVDADDWVEPHWLETLLDTGADAVQHGSRIVERRGHTPEIVQWRHARSSLNSKLMHYTSHTGVYETERLRAAGGYSPAFRMGYDSLLVSVLRIQGEVAIVDEPLYHRRIHKESLSQHGSTKIGSPARLAVRAQLDKAYRKILRLRANPEKVENIIDSLTPAHLWDEVEHYARKVSGGQLQSTA